jgi:hypothetical protein
VRLLILIAASLAALLPHQTPPAAAQPDLRALMIAAARWTARFDHSLSGLLFRERYTQRVTFGNVTMATTDRHLEATLFMLRPPSGRDFVIYRDVYRVNSKDISDHTERLQKLLTDGTSAAHEQARRLTDASARHNAQGFQRNINVPTMVYDFLAPWHIDKIQVRHTGSDTIHGLPVTVVDFEERGRPTLVRAGPNGDAPATGRFWIHPESGAVPRAVAEFVTPRSKGRIEVTLELHPVLQVWVPKEMTEVWQAAGRRLTGLAHYDRFARLNVSTAEIIK